MPYVNYFSTTASIRHTRGIRVAALVAERVEIVDLGGWPLEHDTTLDMIIATVSLIYIYHRCTVQGARKERRTREKRL